MGGRTGTGKSTRVGMVMRTGAGTEERPGTRTGVKVEGIESLGTYKVLIEVGRKTQ